MNHYLVILNNGAEVEVYAPNWMVAPAYAIKEYREKNPDAPDNLGMTDIKAVNADDMVTWGKSDKKL